MVTDVPYHRTFFCNSSTERIGGPHMRLLEKAENKGNELSGQEAT